eukprot:CAMPEP_0119304366 /NCGR_PEP_ID=MMETSP1333-20130426/5608_1 /TAXON_ID=418940 /ORGANISM="Scyphosphaera apsteinii, Strain RCC1455" /LENGTH=93 /DNA_ID=CAMNT_0007307237 /DNA_START=1068 /DNA_END=1349 /DNA_ORIENTATION=-
MAQRVATIHGIRIRRITLDCGVFISMSTQSCVKLYRFAGLSTLEQQGSGSSFAGNSSQTIGILQLTDCITWPFKGRNDGRDDGTRGSSPHATA